jgi:hypothetical protein
MSRWQLSFIVFLASMVPLGGTAVRAQSPKEWRATESQDEGRSVELEQKYTGVRPGSGNNLPRVEALKGKPGMWVTWPGFLLLDDGTSRLFLQTTGPVAYTITEKSRQITLRLKNAKVHLRNNRNPLVTVHFNTPLDRAYLKKNRKSLDLVLELRQPAAPSISQTTDSDGYHYLFIDFPPGDYPVLANKNPAFQSYGTRGPAAESADTVSEESSPDQ